MSVSYSTELDLDDGLKIIMIMICVSRGSLIRLMAQIDNVFSSSTQRALDNDCDVSRGSLIRLMVQVDNVCCVFKMVGPFR